MKLKFFLKKNYLAILVGLVVGLIYFLPNIFFIISLGDSYKGIPMMQTANEDFYLARIHEILDGHLSLGSVFFYEYKNQIPLSPPVGEFFYAFPSLILKISPVAVFLLSRLFLPFLLFFLIYYLTQKLIREPDSFFGKVNSIATALFATLGYGLIDYRTILNYLRRIDVPSDFLIWTRPVNPILGAIFLIFFLIFIWDIVVNKNNCKKISILSASVFLALMIGNYFFSWGIAISICIVMALIYLIKKEYSISRNILLVLISGFLISLPYWYFSWKAKQSLWYPDSILRNGLFYTHYPLFNKLILVVLSAYLFFGVLLIFIKKIKFDKQIAYLNDWYLFCLAIIIGSFWVYVQQFFTGLTIWPYHFAQYSIPLAIITSMVLFFNILKERLRFLLVFLIFIVIFSSLALGFYTQINVYAKSYSYYANLQNYAPLFDWVNKQEKDCVLLIKNKRQNQLIADYSLNRLIPAFTHCNIYLSNYVASLIPKDRIYHNYMVYMFFDGATGKSVEEYIKKHKGEAQSYLHSNWKELFNISDFPDIANNTEKEIQNLEEDYKKFYSQNPKKEISKYKLDYVVIDGDISGEVEKLLGDLNLIFTSGEIRVYEWK